MNRLCAAFAVAALVLTAVLARAAPPTVVPSPGYDARLAEQRKATRTAQPVLPVPLVRRHHRKRPH